MGIETATLLAIAKIGAAAAVAGSAAYTVKHGRKMGKEGAAAKKKKEEEAKKEKARLAMLKEKSPSRRLLGGKPTLG